MSPSRDGNNLAEHAYRIPVQNSTEVAEARRVAVRLAGNLSFDETDAGNVAIIVTEAAKNLFKHAGGGEMLLRAVEHEGAVGIEMLAIDKGPGIADIVRSFQDGFSTAGTPGSGLGAIARLARFHDIYSVRNQGTALLARMTRRSLAAPQSASGPGARFDHSATRPGGVTRENHRGRLSVGGVSAPFPGEPVCGDAWSFSELPGARARIIVADGLGHGLQAADAARAAIRTGQRTDWESGKELMQAIHEALRPTRGAAVAIAELDTGAGTVRFTGIGNIGAVVISPSGMIRRLVSLSGTAGHEARKITEFTYPWEPGSVLIMHSDGLQTHWSLERYPGLICRHPALIAGVLYRDFQRGRDDVTVVVAREAH